MGPDLTQDSPALIPYPKHFRRRDGSLALRRDRLKVGFPRARSDRTRAAVEQFIADLPATADGSPAVPLTIRCEEVGARWLSLGAAEGYRLTVTSSGIQLSAPAEWGILHGIRTLAQLLTDDGRLPICEIEDEPRFPWRGLLVDVARHFIGVEALKRTLRGMAQCKLNVLHLHLTDDQGFRFPSSVLPIPGACQYHRDELVELVDYAASLGIRIVPELDMPGHVTALLAAHPQLGSGATVETTRFGVHEACLDPSRESVYEVLGRLLAEVADVFPDRYVHIGGDEVNPSWWSNSEGVRDFMRTGGLTDMPALQTHFVNRLANMLQALGRVPIGWDEVLHPNLETSVVVQCWRGAASRDRALAGGHDGIVSAPYYLDLFFPADMHYEFDPVAPAAELEAAEDRLLEDPRLAHVAPGMRWTHQWRTLPSYEGPERGKVLGGEACLWSELVTEPLLDGRLWTRLPAVAERLWSPEQIRDVDDMYVRLEAWLARLPATAGIDVLGSFRDWTITVAAIPAAWLPLVEFLEPVKWYARLLGEDALNARLSGEEMPLARPYDTRSPLDNLVDGLMVESFRVREVRRICEAADCGDQAALARLAELCRQWQSLAQRDDCPPVLVPSARQLGATADCLAAYLGGRSRAAALATMNRLNVPQGEMVLALVPMLCAWLGSVQA